MEHIWFQILECQGQRWLEFEIGGKIFTINASTLYIKNSQTYTIHNAGIPLINSKNIYDISDKSSIIVNIELF